MVFCEHAWYFACFWHRFNVCARVRRKSYKNERNLLGILSSFLAHLLKFTKKKFESLSREPWCPPVCPPSTHRDAVNRTQCQHAFTPWPTSRLLSFPWVVFYIEENVRHHIPALYGFRLLRGATVFRYYIWYSRYSSGQNGVTFYTFRTLINHSYLLHRCYMTQGHDGEFRKKSHVQFSFIYAHKNGIGLVASNHITRLLPFQQLCRTGSRFTLPGRRCSALDRLQLPVIIRSFQMDATDLSVLAQF